MRLKFYAGYVIGKLKESLFATFIGLAAGLAAAFLEFLILLFHNLSFELGLQYLHLTILAIYMFVVASFEANVTVPGLILSLRILRENLFIPFVVWLSKFVGVALSLSVLPLGREGPAMFLGTGLGQYISQLLGFPKGQLNYWGTIGAAAFVGAFLKTPLGGTFYVLENRFGKVLNVDFLINAFTASTVSFTVYAYLRGFHPLLHIEGHFHWNLLDLIPSAVLGVLTAIATIVLMLLYEFFKFLARLVPENMRPLAIFPAVLLIFAIAQSHQSIHLLELAVTYQPINEVSSHLYPPSELLGIIALEMVAVSMLLSFGYPGGIVLPLIFIGAALGNLVAHYSSDRLSILALTGAAAMVSAALNIPITAVIMITEMSHQTLLIPEMVWVLTAYFLAKAFKILKA